MMRLIVSILAILFGGNAYCQEISIRINKIQLYEYRAADEGWDFRASYKPDSMYLHFGNGWLTINDEAGSCYEISRQLESSLGECDNFVALDNNNEFCGLQFCFATAIPEGSVRILYVGSKLRIYSVLY